MTSSDSTSTCFLVEWYQSGPAALSVVDAVEHLLRATAVGMSGQVVLLVLALAVPEDQTLFGVFRAASLDAVISTCQRAGWPADRISPDVQPWSATDA